LRGVNMNSIGDYYQADPKLPPVVPVTRADWKRMAAHGFNVVRLLISWSALEPRPGHISHAYLRHIRRTVDDAARYGIYSVIDMHQDAWGKYIASPPGVTCAAGSEPAIGWDGAPKWATITDGASTCTHGSREDSEAVLTAWDRFYSDHNGIQTHLVKDWSVVAREFARHPAVAGFDLLNEPNQGHDPEMLAKLGHYYRRAIRAIRSGERGRHALHHTVFFEATVFGTAVAPNFTDDTNIVFAPHHYGESIGDIPIDGLFDYYQGLATKYRTPMWIGEYGWFSDPAVAQERLGRYAAKEDALLSAGDAWWQWRQACGDPHSVGHPGGTPDAVLIHFQRNGCPGDHNLGVVPEWACTWRPYPRAAPGHLTERHSDCTGNAVIAGTTAKPGTIEIWYPGSARPTVTGTNVSRVHTDRVDGGWSITARVHDDYRIAANTA
jgi:endoglycosylceramidase